MQVKKHIEIKLFRTPGVYWVQLGENLYPVKERVALVISDKEGLEIRKGDDLKAIQIMSNEDKK